MQLKNRDINDTQYTQDTPGVQGTHRKTRKEIIYIQQHSSHYQMDIQLLKNLLDLLCQCNVQMI